VIRGELDEIDAEWQLLKDEPTTSFRVSIIDAARAPRSRGVLAVHLRGEDNRI